MRVLRVTENKLIYLVLVNGDSIYLSILYLFYLEIYPPDSQESDGSAIHRVGNYPNLLPKMPRYCCPLVI